MTIAGQEKSITTEMALDLAAELFASWPEPAETHRPEPNRLEVIVASPEELVPMVAGLRVQRLGYLAAITGLDPGPETGELEALYHFCTAAAVVTLRLRLRRDATVVPSLTGLIPSAESFERELSEMFGVTITGLPNPEHLYLPDEWPAGVYPLLKDFKRERIDELRS
jgi:Ni,Fe-hydrogenase III component G